ncbi:MAG: 4-hydroxy-tetrahydrodipicolinate reductase [Phycisphaerales bacterium]|nr:4-hydroxy-tetrahydrodipicolinate reductase [Phycisphaerales bacterium]
MPDHSPHYHGRQLPIVTISILLSGADGRMGTRVAAACLASGGEFSIGQSCDRARAASESGPRCDVIIDFSSDEGTRSAIDTANRLGIGLLVCTTNLSAITLSHIEALAASAPVMIAPNTSLGVSVLRRLVRDAARMLSKEADIDIIEQHHTKKLDSPSGTAKSLAEAIGTGRGKPLETSRIHAIRAGEIVGEHQVQFTLQGESVTLIHRAQTRDLFARGALQLARWLATRRPGMWTVDDWLDERLALVQ